MKRSFFALLRLTLIVLVFFSACSSNQEKISITLNLHNETKVVYSNNNGEYSLEAPTRAGYKFVAWKTADGTDFSSSGKLTESVTVSAQWELLETSTFEQLKERVEAGADTILLTEDITVTETVYVVSNTKITADKSVVVKRDESFLGDLFVIGETPDGKNVVVLSKKTASLSFKPENGSLIIDGGGVSANGTAFLVLNSSTLNIYNGVYIQNHTKLGNTHLTPERAYNVSYPEKVGGAAAIITSGTMNMYGGVITNCSVNTKDSKNVASADQYDGFDNSSCGGAIYNYGNFCMYGGQISNNSAARGGALYNYRTAKIYAGTFDGNSASAYGGMMYMPNSQYTYSLIGSEGTGEDVVIRNNSAEASGGAIFASHQSATEIFGNTLFDSNTSKSNGGAINMAGALTVNYAVFTKNSATSKGGAIYAYYGDSEYSVRIVNIKSGVFSYNSAPRGAAVGFYGNDDDAENPAGAVGFIGSVRFANNHAYKNSSNKYGNGSAIYAALLSKVSVSSEAVFVDNVAEDKNATEIYTTSNATVTVEGAGASASN